MSGAILFSFAHPDDESFSGSGLASMAGTAGMRSVLVTATRGQRGSAGDPPLCTIDELPVHRERELREAAAVIGFDEVHVLDYHDQQLAQAPADEIRESLVAFIRRLQPLVVATFDPNGVNRHPDHVAISWFTMDAVAAAADPRWVPHTGEPHVVPRVIWTAPLPPWESIKIARPQDRPGFDYILDVSPWRERRIAALRAHRTQHQSIDRCFFNQPDPGRILDIEIWRHAFGKPPARRPSPDVLEGLIGRM